MNKYVIDESTLKNLGEAIRGINGESASYTPAEMVEKIKNLEAGGSPDTIRFTIDGVPFQAPTGTTWDDLTNIYQFVEVRCGSCDCNYPMFEIDYDADRAIRYMGIDYLCPEFDCGGGTCYIALEDGTLVSEDDEIIAGYKYVTEFVETEYEITFYVDGNEYTTLADSTWAEFIDQHNEDYGDMYGCDDCYAGVSEFEIDRSSQHIIYIPESGKCLDCYPELKEVWICDPADPPMAVRPDDYIFEDYEYVLGAYD